MRTFLSFFACLFILLSCSSNDVNPKDVAIKKACQACQTESADMDWLRTIVNKNDGNVYAIHTSEGMMIVHQPVVMSCLSCVRYTCSGLLVGYLTETFEQELQAGVKKSNLIYEARF